MKSIDFEQLPATPWKNGGGVTRELASFPQGAGLDDFAWRISIADVAQSGPFSAFPGIDRVIALLDGDGMHLEFADGRTHALTEALAPFRFCGDDPLYARLAGTPSKDFNLMLRRAAVDGTVRIARDACELSCRPGFLLLFCARGSWEAVADGGDRHVVTPLQTLLGDSTGGSVSLRPLAAQSALLAVNIFDRTAAV